MPNLAKCPTCGSVPEFVYYGVDGSRDFYGHYLCVNCVEFGPGFRDPDLSALEDICRLGWNDEYGNDESDIS